MRLPFPSAVFRDDDPGAALARVVRVGLSARLWTAGLRPGLPAALGVALRHGLSVRDVHALHARLTPHRPCVVDAQRTVSWRELDQEINRLAHGLRGRFGLGPGGVLVLLTENRIETLAAWMAALRLGARAVHASWRTAPEELEWLLGHTGARLALVSGWSREAAEAVGRRARPLDRVDVDPGAGPGAVAYGALLEAGSPDWPGIPRRVGEGASVVLTSGTTGRPKGAVRDFARYGPGELLRILERLPLRAGDRHLLVAPLDHSAGQAFTLLQAALGATTWMRPRFEAEDALRVLSREAIHSVFLVPTMIRRILDLPAPVQAAHPTPALRALISGAAPFPEALRRRAIARFGARVVFDFYGATELGWVTLLDGREMLARPGSVGRPLAGQAVRIVDEAGRVLPPGRVGRVQVRTTQAMGGYLDDPAATRAVRQGTWASVEDLGRVDPGGYLYLTGRARDVVVSGGVNLHPKEIEDALAAHPQVAEAAVFGVPDPDWGERLVAAVVPAGPAWDPGALEGWLRGRLAAHKVPRSWHRVDRLPRTPTGKVRKQVLAEALAGAPGEATP